MSRRSLARCKERLAALPVLACALLAGFARGEVATSAAWATPATTVSSAPDPLEEVKAAIRLKQFAAAAGHLQQLAQAGNARAQYLLGVFYLNGLNGPRDVRQARSWLERSSAQGDERAVIALRDVNGSGNRPARARVPIVEFADARTRNEALWLAATRGDLPAVKLLTDRTSVNSHDDFGRGALFRAAQAGQAETVELLLRSGAEVNAADHYGMTALMLAARSGQGDVVALLLKAGARVELADHGGNTALTHARTHGGDPRVVGLLLSADPHLGATGLVHQPAAKIIGPVSRATPPDQDLYSGWSDLAVAASRSSPALLEQLRRGETGVNDTISASTTLTLLVAARSNAPATLDALLSWRPALATSARAKEAFLLAAETGEDRVLATMLAHGISPDVLSPEGAPAIVAAARAGHSGTVGLLVSAHADAGSTDRGGQSALSVAARNSDSALVEILLRAGAPVNSADAVGRTALWYAARVGDSKGVVSLLQHGADPDHADSSGVTPLGAACAGGSASIVQVLLGRGARLEARTKDGDTPLLLAVARGRQAIADLLLLAHADKDAQNRFGDTPLILASRNGDLQMTRRMLAAGAAAGIRNNNRQTAADVAVARGFRDVARLFETG